MLKTAEHWYEIRRISHDLTLIYEPHVHPFMRCNIWHLRGRDSDLLVDTGLGVSSLKDTIRDMIDKPVIALATHIHYDHVGCLHEFDQRLMHASEAPDMAVYDEFNWLRMSDVPAAYRNILEGEPYSDHLMDALPSPGFAPEDYRITPTTITRALHEGDVVDLGDKALRVYHLPGHSPGSIGLWEPTSSTLFSGDALYDGELLDELPNSSIPDYLATMQRLRTLPVEVVHGGHEPSFGRERMIELIDAYVDWRTA